MARFKLLTNVVIYTCLSVISVSYFPLSAFAIQLHGDPEGLFVHQIAHVFFILSMTILLYWLFKMKILFSKGWRFIGLAAAFFILWNMDAFIGHWIEGSKGVGMVVEGSLWSGRVKFTELNDIKAILYYIVKLDHFWCVPAIVSLYLGLRELCINSDNTENSQETS